MKNIVPFTLEQRLLYHLILHTFHQNNMGLLDGRMGTSITLFLVGRETGEKAYTNLAEKLLDSIIENIRKDLPIYFPNGLCGICWGIDFLLHEGFIKGKSDEICSEMDKSIMQINPARLNYSLEYGLQGFLHYVLAHLTVCKDNPFDDNFMNSLFLAIKDIPISNINQELKRMCDLFRNNYKGKPLEYSFNIRNFINDSYSNLYNSYLWP
jgi:lantibiotic modifying enzyme